MTEEIKEPYKVMVVDDSLVIRGIVNRMIQTDSQIQVVKSVGNGQLAVTEAVKDPSIEVVVLDIEMPVMDGLTALPKILEANPSIQVIMSSTLTLKNAEVSLKALSLGACDYVTKPSSTSTLSGDETYKNDLIEKIKVFGERARSRGGIRKKPVSPASPAPSSFKPEQKEMKVTTTVRKSLYSTDFTLVKPNFKMVPEVIAIGSSTGGPPALFKIFEELKTSIKQPILITQHMPATFTKILAEHISRISGKVAVEGEDGMVIENNKIYIAPGGFHMIVDKKGASKVIKITSAPAENFCRPAVDPMFRSIAEHYGTKALAIVLTGMGYDGSKGSKVILEAGGNVIAQDEASSIVWGMPGATAQLGVCCAVLPLDEIASYIKKVS
ncbi:MAG: Chemotaxis response regulator protein-glutamate methylesterase [Alphaproteobacteria bacterium ADurb.Bin438]|nr:MAG: Chemotaxis response regulator protein-glutamate methylesterase [Alphaproteobacteria bacterium ADurb.Bin438]